MWHDERQDSGLDRVHGFPVRQKLVICVKITSQVRKLKRQTTVMVLRLKNTVPPTARNRAVYVIYVLLGIVKIRYYCQHELRTTFYETVRI